MLRGIALLAVLLSCSPLSAGEASTIASGMDLATAKQILHAHGYEVGAEQALAMVAKDREHGLEFCRIDSKATLVLNYMKSTQEVVSLTVCFISNYAPKTHRDQLSIEVVTVTLENDGTYSLNIKRQPDDATGRAAQ